MTMTTAAAAEGAGKGAPGARLEEPTHLRIVCEECGRLYCVTCWKECPHCNSDPDS